MRVLESVIVSIELADLNSLTYHTRPSGARAGGVHVSSILKYLAQKLNMWTVKDAEDENCLRMLLGMGFEELAARLYPDMQWQIGEMTADGISGNPDGVRFRYEFDRYVVAEYKYTGYSQRKEGAKTQPDGKTVARADLKDGTEMWLWNQQGLGYINLLRQEKGMTDLNTAEYHICWKYGPYVYPMKEVYGRYLIEYTEDEIANNWAMMLAYKDDVVGEVEKGAVK